MIRKVPPWLADKTNNPNKTDKTKPSEEFKLGMLKSIEIGNFKAFKEKTHIPLAPITLIFGENSSGKSAIIKSILLQQIGAQSNHFMKRNDGNLSSEIGSYWDYIYNHETNNKMSFRADFDVTDTFWAPFSHLGKRHKYGVEFVFGRKRLGEYVHDAKLFLNDLLLADFINYQAVEDEDYEGEYNPLWLKSFTDNNSVMDAIVQRYVEFRHQYMDFFKNRVSDIERGHKEEKEKYRKWIEGGNQGTFTVSSTFELDEYKRLYSKLENSIETSPSVLKELALAEIDYTYLNLFDDFRYDNFTWDKMPEDVDRNFTQDFNEQFLRSSEKREVSSSTLKDALFQIADRPLFNLGEFTARLFSHFKARFTESVSIGPIRAAFDRGPILITDRCMSVGYKGERLSDVIHEPKLLRRVNRWLELLDTGHQLLLTGLTFESNEPHVIDEDSRFLEVIDTRRDPQVTTAYCDVGYGISQIVPIIAQSELSKGQIITLEQPELHIHPRLQADMGDVFYKSFKERGNQFIIETHSEHLALRMQKLIRTGKLKPEEVAILYVSRSEDGSNVERLRLDENGQFIDPWPGGFFPERLQEVFGE